MTDTNYRLGQTIYIINNGKIEERTLTKVTNRSIYLSDGTRMRADGSHVNDYFHRLAAFIDRGMAEQRASRK